ncbi:SDR family oxidoreductase [Paeniroseomonas aquatica]|uniref:SDR family oxidoreductase n=1 Tax=Paeniroseomonas aquatica TaxID=373043 RepID=A0ABT8A2W2_9PROT|nr:SDR family NAD(P)-dependent oxidoreductase [Paeniroseomonas aquatica]MDN3564084.1 SDR family oxidoreductase [Paeniroseomonas aquatica]
MTEFTACIIGASRGLGLGLAREYLARGWRVIGTVRGDARGGLHALQAGAGDRLAIERLDINDPGQLAALRGRLAGARLDVLFVNAGVSNGPAERIGDVSTEDFTRVMVTNALSPMRVVEALQERVPPQGLIALMSSGLGSVAGNESGGWEVYRASKAALNTLMRSFAARRAGDPRSFALVAPGWVRTDMGGPQASLDVGTSTAGILDSLAGLAGRPGLHYLDYRGQRVAW